MGRYFTYAFEDKRYHTWNYHLKNRFGQKIFKVALDGGFDCPNRCLLYTSPSPRDRQKSRMPSSA